MRELIIVGIACIVSLLVGHIGGYKLGKEKEQAIKTEEPQITVVVKKKYMNEFLHGEMKPKGFYLNDKIATKVKVIGVEDETEFRKDKE